MFLLVLQLEYAFSFLLGASSQSTLGQNSLTDKHFVIVFEFLSEEKQLRRQLEQVVGQLQQEVLALKQQIATNSGNTSYTADDVTSLKKEIRDLKKFNADLQTSLSNLSSEHLRLKSSFESQTTHLHMYRNRTEHLKIEVNNLEKLQSINQIQTLQNIQHNVSVLYSKTAWLESQETARQHDLVSIYKQVTESTNDILDLKSQNREFINETENQFDVLRGEVNTNISSIQM